jgi:hypothetical protein
MAAALVPDILWEVIEPLVPLPKPKQQGGRPRIPECASMASCLSFAVAYLGRCCRRNWAVARA